MRVLFFVELLAGAVGGAQRSLLNLASHLSGQGHEIVIATHGVYRGAPHFDYDPSIVIADLNPDATLPPTSVSPRPPRPAAVKTSSAKTRANPLKTLRQKLELGSPVFRRVGQNFSTPFRRVAGRFQTAIKEHRPDIVVAWMPFVAPFVAKAARQAGVPAVFSLRNTPERDLKVSQDPKKALEVLRFQDALFDFDAVTYLVPEFEPFLPAQLDRSKCFCIPNPIHLNRVDAQRLPDLAERPRRILFVGRLSDDKRPEWALSAFAQIAENFPEWSLEMFARGVLEAELKAQIERIGLADRIAFRSHVKDLVELYREGAVFCFPSRFEGMPNALIEAMTSGLPCVGVDDCLGVVSLLKDDAGILVAERDGVSGLAQALSRLMGDETARETFGAAARQRVVDLAQRDPHADWEALLEKTLSRRRETPKRQSVGAS